MFHEDSFSLDSFSTESWMFLLEVPYFDLSGKQRVYVRHVLQSVYAQEIVERIVSVAERNNLSVIDSVEVVRAQTGEQTLFVMPRRAVTAENPQRQSKQAVPKQIKETRSVCAVTGDESIHASAEQLRISAYHSVESIVSSNSKETLFITNKPSRSAHNNA